ncbi:hypothetical protein [Treponema sp. C6A8]|uniref:hypothetical protein n=1 Tax=Treponema sp. C6A8 TaxID=1410609 RepID=UPI0012DF0767|nr:hypothetical protein [Treponema sp. C6A8]
MGLLTASAREWKGVSYDSKCSYCGKFIPKGTVLWDWGTTGSDPHSSLYCSKQCCLAAHGQGSGSSDTSSGGSSGMTASAGIGMAAAGLGAAAKGFGALTKGAGSLLGGLGKGAGVMADAMKSGLDGTKAEFGKTHSAEEEIIAINKMTFSSDPEEYKKEIWALFDKATSKPADLLRDTFVIKAAKKKLIHELDICKLKNPEMFSQFAQLYEELNKKKKLFGIFG